MCAYFVRISEKVLNQLFCEILMKLWTLLKEQTDF